MKVLVYLKKELAFSGNEWISLDQETKEWYKNAAIEEMNTLGIEIIS